MFIYNVQKTWYRYSNYVFMYILVIGGTMIGIIGLVMVTAFLCGRKRPQQKSSLILNAARDDTGDEEAGLICTTDKHTQNKNEIYPGASTSFYGRIKVVSGSEHRNIKQDGEGKDISLTILL